MVTIYTRFSRFLRTLPGIVGTLTALGLVLCAGCGTMKTSNTSRTATEQLLLTNSVDKTMNQLDLTALAGRKVYFDHEYIADSQDSKYLLSSLRQRIMVSGAILQEKKGDAEYIIEVRVGAFGTDQSDMIVGVSETTAPTSTSLNGSLTIPEFSIIKRIDQKAVLKMHLFVVHRGSGRIVWQSGELLEKSDSRSLWAFGTGPFQWGDIHDGTHFNGDSLQMPQLISGDDEGEGRTSPESDLPNVSEQTFYIGRHVELPPAGPTISEKNEAGTAKTAPPVTATPKKEKTVPEDATSETESTEVAKSANVAGTDSGNEDGVPRGGPPAHSGLPPVVPQRPAW